MIGGISGGFKSRERKYPYAFWVERGRGELVFPTSTVNQKKQPKTKSAGYSRLFNRLPNLNPIPVGSDNFNFRKIHPALFCSDQVRPLRGGYSIRPLRTDLLSRMGVTAVDGGNSLILASLPVGVIDNNSAVLLFYPT